MLSFTNKIEYLMLEYILLILYMNMYIVYLN